MMTSRTFDAKDALPVCTRWCHLLFASLHPRSLNAVSEGLWFRYPYQLAASMSRLLRNCDCAAGRELGRSKGLQVIFQSIVRTVLLSQIIVFLGCSGNRVQQPEFEGVAVGDVQPGWAWATVVGPRSNPTLFVIETQAEPFERPSTRMMRVLVRGQQSKVMGTSVVPAVMSSRIEVLFERRDRAEFGAWSYACPSSFGRIGLTRDAVSWTCDESRTPDGTAQSQVQRTALPGKARLVWSAEPNDEGPPRRYRAWRVDVGGHAKTLPDVNLDNGQELQGLFRFDGGACALVSRHGGAHSNGVPWPTLEVWLYDAFGIKRRAMPLRNVGLAASISMLPPLSMMPLVSEGASALLLVPTLSSAPNAQQIAGPVDWVVYAIGERDVARWGSFRSRPYDWTISQFLQRQHDTLATRPSIAHLQPGRAVATWTDVEPGQGMVLRIGHVTPSGVVPCPRPLARARPGEVVGGRLVPTSIGVISIIGWARPGQPWRTGVWGLRQPSTCPERPWVEVGN